MDWASSSDESSADSAVEGARGALEQGIMAIMIAQQYISDPEFVNTLLTASRSGSPEDPKEADPK